MQTKIIFRPSFAGRALLAVAMLFGIPVLVLIPLASAHQLMVAALIALSIAVFTLGLLARSAYRWVEIEGDTIRGRKLLGARKEWKVQDISGIKSIDFEGQDAKGKRGYNVSFRDGSKIRLSRAEMSGVDEFLKALAEQIKDDGKDRADESGAPDLKG
jgi:hypothetical protein